MAETNRCGSSMDVEVLAPRPESSNGMTDKKDVQIL